MLLTSVSILMMIQATAAGSKPTLEVTMDYIRKRVAAEGIIIYDGLTHDSAAKTDRSTRYTVEASKVAIGGPCRIDYHWKTSADDKVHQDQDAAIDFARVETVTLTSMEEYMVGANSVNGRSYNVRISPQVWVVSVNGRSGLMATFDFRDREVAQRVQSAMKNASELCGGAGHDPFAPPSPPAVKPAKKAAPAPKSKKTAPATCKPVATNPPAGMSLAIKKAKPPAGSSTAACT